MLKKNNIGDKVGRISKSSIAYLDKRVKALISVLVILLGFFFFSSLILLEIPDSKREIIVFILGNITGYISLILSYFFGSSDDREKREDKEDKGTS